MKKFINSLNAFPFLFTGFLLTGVGLLSYFTENIEKPMFLVVVIITGVILLTISAIIFLIQNIHLLYIRWILLIFGILAFVIVGGRIFYVLSPNSYHNWSIEKKQAYEFNLLVRKLAENPQAFQRIEITAEKNEKEVKKVTIDDLKNWTSFSFLCLRFPDGYCDEVGTFSIHYSNYEGKADFFSKVTNGSLESGYMLSIPYYVAKGEPIELSEEKEALYVLQSIIYARRSI